MKITVSIPFEAPPEQPLELAAYLVDRGGTIVASAPIKDGKFELDVDEARAHGLSLSIAPVRKDLGKRLPTKGQLERLQAYEPTFRFDPKVREYKLEAIPAAISKIWWLCACRVRGRVVKPVASGGITIDMPVCHARIHICEVDPIWILLRKLPDREIFRLRDDLVRAIQRPFPWPPEPGPLHDVERIAPVALEGLDRHQMASLLALAEGGPPAQAASVRTAAFAATPRTGASLSLAAQASLASAAATTVRAALIDNIHLILPYLCLWRWLWPWLWRCDEVRVVETDDNGRFDVTIYHRCDDQPDLYFWVEYFIAGAWTPVYQPWLPCSTYWNFDCTSEVTIRVTDPRVPYCGGHDSPQGKVVVVKTIGNDVSISEVLGAAAGAREGLVPDGTLAYLPLAVGQDAPFAGTLELRADFGEQLLASGVTQYRWSYRQLRDAAGLAVADVSHIMTRQVVRHYRTWSGGNPIDLPHQLGPLLGNFFEVWNPVTSTTPAGDHNWQVDDAHEDLVSAFFETGPLDPTRTRNTDVVGHHLDDAKAGLYELRLELFHANGSLVDWTTEGIGLSETNVPAPFGANPMTTQASPDAHRVLNGAGHTMGFRLNVLVDNSFCEARIFDVTAPAAAGPCGFIDYAPGASAHVSFQARHAHDYAAFWFEVDKGSSGAVSPATVPAWAPVGVTPVNGFVRGGASVWAKDVPITGPGSLVDSPSPCPDGRAAFAETIYVAALAIDGWQRASWLDASATPKAFALNPAHHGH